MRRLDELGRGGTGDPIDRLGARSSRRQHQQQRVYSGRPQADVRDDRLAQHNAKLLMRMYEKRTKEAEDRSRQLEEDLEETRSLARRYRHLYLAERDGGGGGGGSSRPATRLGATKQTDASPGLVSGGGVARTPGGGGGDLGADTHPHRVPSPQDGGRPQRQHPSHQVAPLESASGRRASPRGAAEGELGRRGEGEGDGDLGEGGQADRRPPPPPADQEDSLNEDDLDDDRAQFARHMLRVAESKAMITTSPIRVVDVIRKNEVLLRENEALKRDVQRLKWDNAQMVKQVKHTTDNQYQIMANIAASETARDELHRRLEREQRQHQRLSRSMTRQASDWIQARKELQEQDTQRRFNELSPLSPWDAEERSVSHAVKKNVYLPRKMFAVEQYAQADKKI